MAVFKIEKNKNFTIMSNHHLQDKSLSLKAKGLLSYMLSLPEDWDYSLTGLCSICKENKTAIRSALKELQLYGYLSINKIRGKKGYFEYEYLIYEVPKQIDLIPDIENRYMDELDMENITQKSTNIQIDKDDKTNFDKNINYLTLELIKKGYIDENDSQIFYYNDLFEELLEENDFVDLIKIIHYIVPRVVKNKFYDEEGYKIENKYGYMKNAIYNNINKLNINSEELWEDDLVL